MVEPARTGIVATAGAKLNTGIAGVYLQIPAMIPLGGTKASELRSRINFGRSYTRENGYACQDATER